MVKPVENYTLLRDYDYSGMSYVYGEATGSPIPAVHLFCTRTWPDCVVYNVFLPSPFQPRSNTVPVKRILKYSSGNTETAVDVPVKWLYAQQGFIEELVKLSLSL